MLGNDTNDIAFGVTNIDKSDAATVVDVIDRGGCDAASTCIPPLGTVWCGCGRAA